jgi:hypothetical protein
MILFMVGINRFLARLVPFLPKTIRNFSSVILSFASFSFLYFLAIVLNQGVIFPLILLSCINLFHLYLRYAGSKPLHFDKTGKIDNADFIIPLTGMLLMSVFFLFKGSKYGDYDAWAIWTTHAKFLSAPQIWTRIFDDTNIMSHSDYPLMLPSLVAFFWKIINTTSFIVPLLLSFFILTAVILLLYYALADEFQNKTYACLGLFILVADYNFQLLSSAQCADTLLSLFILLTFVLNNTFRSYHPSNLSYILGFACASCTWIKNEGDLFYVTFTAVFLITNSKHFNNITKYLVGSIVPLFITVYFKLIYAPTNDLVAASQNQTLRIVGDLQDKNRYISILKALANELFSNFWMAFILFLLLLLVNRNFYKSLPFLVLLIMFSGYMMIYLITPYNLTWHLSTSLSRVLYQIYPSFLYISIMAFGNAKWKNLKSLV